MATRNLLLNPFKEIGILHNKGLNYIVNHLDSTIPVTQEAIINLTCTYISQIGVRATDVDLAWYNELISKSLNRLRQYPLEASLWKTDVSRQGIEYISEINDLSDDYRAAISAVERIQSTILDSKMLDSDKEYPLLYAAVTLASIGILGGGIKQSCFPVDTIWGWANSPLAVA